MSKIMNAIAALGVVAGLGIAALPLSSYAEEATTGPVTVQTTVNNTIGITSSKDLVDLGEITGGSPVSEASTVITVSGTTGTKYNLYVEDKDADTDMVNANGDTIATNATNLVDDTATSAWGFKVAANGAWKAMTAKGTQTEITTAAATLGEESDEYEVYFGVSVSNTQAPGVYSDQVIFTAVTTE